MVARVTTVAFEGTNVLDIDVQVQMSSGMPKFNLVGLPDKAVAESRERVRAALFALGLALPAKHIAVNLAPADVLKEGSHFDLPTYATSKDKKPPSARSKSSRQEAIIC